MATNETGYRIWRSTSGGTFTLLTTLQANVSSYGNTGLRASTGYKYRVCAGAQGGGEVCASDISGTTFDQTSQEAKFVSQSVPNILLKNQTVQVAITYENNGKIGWKSSDLVRLGSQSPTNNNIWGYSGRVNIPEDTVVYPGSRYTFRFNVIAPAKSGNYDFQVRMLQENVRWFGEARPMLVIKAQ